MGAVARRVFCSGVRSQSHVVYAASWLRDLLRRTDGPVTLVNLGRGSFLGRQAVTDADVRRLLPDDPRLTIEQASSLRGRRGERLAYLAIGAPGIKPYGRLLAANPGRAFHVVVTDEGLGTYGTWQTRRDAWLREGGQGWWPTVRALATTGARRVLTTQRWALYERRGASWAVHEEVAAEFRRHGGVRRAASPRTAVLLSQPWVELGVLDAGAYAAHVDRLAAQASGAGLRFVVRPHPVEDPARYAAHEVYAGPEPAELDARIVGASVVLGATSTALLNLRALYGVPALRVAAPGLEFLDRDLSADQASLLGQFVGRPVADDETGGALRALATQGGTL